MNEVPCAERRRELTCSPHASSIRNDFGVSTGAGVGGRHVCTRPRFFAPTTHSRLATFSLVVGRDDGNDHCGVRARA